MRVRGTVPLTHGQEVEYKMFGFFKREEDETAIIRKVYQGMNQEYVRQLFYGGDKKPSWFCSRFGKSCTRTPRR